jgi:hypothetical protein
MLGKASNARMTLPIAADATQVAPSRVSEKDVGAQIDGLRRPHKLPADARQLGQVDCAIDRDQEIDVLWDRLGRCQGTEERDALRTGANTGSPHEGQYGEKQGTARFGNCRRWAARAIAMPSARRGSLRDIRGVAIHSRCPSKSLLYQSETHLQSPSRSTSEIKGRADKLCPAFEGRVDPKPTLAGPKSRIAASPCLDPRQAAMLSPWLGAVGCISRG